MIQRAIRADEARAAARRNEATGTPLATQEASTLPGVLVFGLSYGASLIAGIYGLAGPPDAAGFAGACVPLGGALLGMRSGNAGYIVFAVSDTITQWIGVGLLIAELAAPRRAARPVSFTGNGLVVRF